MSDGARSFDPAVLERRLARRGGLFSDAMAPKLEAPVFAPRTLAWLVSICAASLAATLVFLVFAGEMAESRDSSAFSRSAIGHRALVEFLRSVGVEAIVSRYHSAEKASKSAPLLLIEPRVENVEEPSEFSPGLGQMVSQALAGEAAVVVVLPKWDGSPHPAKRAWLGSVSLLPREVPAKVLSSVLGEDCSADSVAVVTSPASSWKAFGEAMAVELAPAQLVRPGCGALEAIVTSEDGGLLVARAAGKELYIVSDPDVLSTSGLAHGDNSVLVHRLLSGRLHAESVVIDEVLHGFGRVPTLWNELFSMPLLPVTLHVLALLGLVLWSAASRFGKPEKLAPRVAPGKAALVASTADLLSAGRHHEEALVQYLRMVLRKASAAFGLSPGQSEEQQARELAAIGRVKGVREDIVALHGRVVAMRTQKSDARSVIEVATAIARWQEEMKHGHR